MSLTLPILEHMKVDSQTIQFMTLLLEKTIQTRDCKITLVLKLKMPMGQIQRLIQHLKVHLITYRTVLVTNLICGLLFFAFTVFPLLIAV